MQTTIGVFHVEQSTFILVICAHLCCLVKKDLEYTHQMTLSF